MLRGINKQIIEINDTGSNYFEKILFFVKSENFNENIKLEEEARRIMLSYFVEDDNGKYKEGILRYTDNKRKKKNRIILFAILGVIALGTVLTFIFV